MSLLTLLNNLIQRCLIKRESLTDPKLLRGSVHHNKLSKPFSLPQVRLLQQATRRQGPQEQNLRRVRRTSSRRSAYAFAHQQGYGELITSGKNMKVPTSSTSTYPLSSPSRGPADTNLLKNTNAEETTSTSRFRRESEPNQEVTVEDLEAR